MPVDDKGFVLLKTAEKKVALLHASYTEWKSTFSIDIYGSDACLMAGVEVANEVSDSVAVYVASEAEEPGAGWPYDTWLRRWAADPTISSAKIGAILAEEYAKLYNSGSQAADATMSVFDLSQTASLNAAIATLAPELKVIAPVRSWNAAENSAKSESGTAGGTCARNKRTSTCP